MNTNNKEQLPIESDQAAPIEEQNEKQFKLTDELKAKIGEPKPYDFDYPYTQYNVILNGILFHAISPPDNYNLDFDYVHDQDCETTDDL